MAVGIGSGLEAGPDSIWPPIPITLPGFGISTLAHLVAGDVISGWLQTLDRWMGDGAGWMFIAVWKAMSSTTEPVISGGAFESELHVMGLIGAAVIVPLLLLGVIQAIVRQDGGGIVRTVAIRLPLAMLFTGAAVEAVSLGLAFTDQASTALLDTGKDPTEKFINGLAHALVVFGNSGVGAFGGALVLVFAVFVAFALWIELAVRSAGVAAATMFLPLALAGLVWPATSHWARRLGETLAALVLMKLVMAAVLALAAGALGGDGDSLAAVVEGLALLLVTAITPFALMRLLPMIEAGAISHLEGVARRPTSRAASTLAWMAPSAFGGRDASGLGTAAGTGQTVPGSPGGSGLGNAGSGGSGSPPSGATSSGSPPSAPPPPAQGAPTSTASDVPAPPGASGSPGSPPGASGSTGSPPTGVQPALNLGQKGFEGLIVGHKSREGRVDGGE